MKSSKSAVRRKTHALPLLRFEEDGPEFKGRTGFTGETRTVAVGTPLSLTVHVDHPDDRSWVAWTLHQGPGDAE